MADTEISANTDTKISSETDTEISAETDTEADNLRSLVVTVILALLLPHM